MKIWDGGCQSSFFVPALMELPVDSGWKDPQYKGGHWLSSVGEGGVLPTLDGINKTNCFRSIFGCRFRKCQVYSQNPG